MFPPHTISKQRNMFKCGLNCLDDKNSVKQAEQCIDDCGHTMQLAMNTLQTEITAFQVSLSTVPRSILVLN